MSSKVGLEKRRPDTVISECRVHRRDASENEGWEVSAKALGESVHQEPADKLVRAIAMVFQRPGPAPIIGCDQPAVRDGNGLHLAWGPASCDLYCSAGGRNWPHRFTRRSAPNRGRRTGHGWRRSLIVPRAAAEIQAGIGSPTELRPAKTRQSHSKRHTETAVILASLPLAPCEHLAPRASTRGGRNDIVAAIKTR
jgi:hypothetical protein